MSLAVTVFPCTPQVFGGSCAWGGILLNSVHCRGVVGGESKINSVRHNWHSLIFKLASGY